MKIADRIVIGLCALMLIAGFSAPAFAQVPTPTVTGGAVVSTCGTAPAGYPTTGIGPETVDVHGNKCMASSATPGANKTEVIDASGNILPTLPSGPVTVANADGVVVSYESLTSGGITVAMTATTSTAVTNLSGTAGKYYYITAISVSNSHASVGTDVLIQDGSGGTTIWLCAAASAYGGCTQTFNPPLKVPTIGNGIFAQNVTTGSNTKVTINAFQSVNSY